MRCLIFLLIVLLGGCHSISKTNASTSVSDPDSLVASIERTVCFGSCPAYKLSLFRSGFLMYDGFKYTSKTGKYFTWLSQSQADELCLKAVTAGYFDLNDSYHNEMIADLPTVTTFLKCGNRVKQVVFFDLECPAALKSVQGMLDGLAPPDSMWKPLK